MLSRDTEDTKKTQIKLLTVKNTLGEINSRSDPVEESISELENMKKEKLNEGVPWWPSS